MIGSQERSLIDVSSPSETNQDKKGDETKIMTQQYIRLNTRVKEIQ